MRTGLPGASPGATEAAGATSSGGGSNIGLIVVGVLAALVLLGVGVLIGRRRGSDMDVE